MVKSVERGVANQLRWVEAVSNDQATRGGWSETVGGTKGASLYMARRVPSYGDADSSVDTNSVKLVNHQYVKQR